MRWRKHISDAMSVRSYKAGRPISALLIVEVNDSTLAYDRFLRPESCGEEDPKFSPFNGPRAFAHDAPGVGRRSTCRPRPGCSARGRPGLEAGWPGSWDSPRAGHRDPARPTARTA